jgi:16S rRNA (cytosine1402-N4)-methyltransferase
VNAWPHRSVLLEPVVEALRPSDGEIHVDCTVGAGGHAEALLDAAHIRLVGLDRDPAALALARERLARFGDRVTLVHASFGNFRQVLDSLGLLGVDGVVADLGVSSMQIDSPERGFSFLRAGPVDMRMDPTLPGSAAQLVDRSSEEDLARIIEDYGEERHARRIARTIVAGRPWVDTVALAEAIARAVPGGRGQRIHPATRTFQALRIHVNDELGELRRLLPAAAERLRPGGRLAILTFHSLEDRIVKQFLAGLSGRTSPRDPYGHPLVPPTFRVPPSLAPSPDDPNPRARSSRLRSAVRLP